MSNHITKKTRKRSTMSEKLGSPSRLFSSTLTNMKGSDEKTIISIQNMSCGLASKNLFAQPRNHNHTETPRNSQFCLPQVQGKPELTANYNQQKKVSFNSKDIEKQLKPKTQPEVIDYNVDDCQDDLERVRGEGGDDISAVSFMMDKLNNSKYLLTPMTKSNPGGVLKKNSLMTDHNSTCLSRTRLGSKSGAKSMAVALNQRSPPRNSFRLNISRFRNLQKEPPKSCMVQPATRDFVVKEMTKSEVSIDLSECSHEEVNGGSKDLDYAEEVIGTRDIIVKEITFSSSASSESITKMFHL